MPTFESSRRFSVAKAVSTIVCAAAACAAAAPAAQAALGDIDPSGAVQGTPILGGVVIDQRRVDEGGTTVHAYLTSAGEVFAYTWQGPNPPDLRAILGTHLPTYRAAAVKAQLLGGIAHVRRVAQPDVVVETGGVMRGYFGRAWLPSEVPAGVSVTALQ